jgi:hypothetical protein
MLDKIIWILLGVRSFAASLKEPLLYFWTDTNLWNTVYSTIEI